MGVYGLPGTVKIWHFELTQDHLDTDDTEVTSFLLQIPIIWVSTDRRECRGRTLSFLFATPTIWVSTDSPGHQQPRSRLTQDHLDTDNTEGMQRSLCFLFSTPTI